MLHGKRAGRRTVGIDRGANPNIEARFERRETLGVPAATPLFCMMKGVPTAPTRAGRLFRGLAQSAGIEKRVHPHALRHTHALEVMMEGVPMPVIQSQLGHASLATTGTYLAHIAPKQVIEAMGQREWCL